MGREKSDGRGVPQDRVTPVPVVMSRQGKATTAVERARTEELSTPIADRPKGVSTSDCGCAHGKEERSGVTMEQIAEEANLLEAFRRVANNRGAPGPDGQSIEQVRSELAQRLIELRKALVTGTYQPGKIRRVWIPKTSGGQRGLGIPNVIDRWVQQATLQKLAPLYEPTFHPSCHGFREGRSCHTAVAQAKEHVATGRYWMVDIDLEKFFDRVPHERLLAKLGLRICDRRILRMIRRMLRAKVVMPEGVVVLTEEGTPQGGPLSPLLSNIVLDELDHELERRGHRFVRYADDLSIYVRSERAGQRVFESVTRFLEKRMRLTVNRNKSAVARPRGRHLLGFTLRPNIRKQQVELDLSVRTKDRLSERIRTLTPRTWGQSLRACIERINRFLRGWAEYFGVAFWAAGRARYADGHIRRRLRAILLAHWKSTQRMRKNLQRLGVDPVLARGVSRSTAAWRRSNSQAARYGIRNKWFERWGLLSLETLCKSRLSKGLPPIGEAPKTTGWGSNEGPQERGGW
jgi:RNA-directed DNA polymerase